tara:strand:+ start:67638 stop:69272 length:1635 start_codon:yes stop_codon:yes gene_type:complete
LTNVIETDIAIIGAGVAGALAAYHLSQQGLKVALLDAGLETSRPEAVERYHRSTSKGANSPYMSNPLAPMPQSSDDYYKNVGSTAFNGLYMRGVGGTTWHWTGFALRLRPDDLSMQTKFGVAEDWPLSYDDLAPWYERAENEMGVAGFMGENYGAPRTKDYPLPGIPSSYLDAYVSPRIKSMQLSLSPFPQARNSIAFQGRPPCCGNNNCVPICPVHAKYDATVHVEKARQLGASIYSSHVITRLNSNAEGQIESAEFLNDRKQKGIVKAQYFMVACHAIENPRLLLLSKGPHTPKGVANSSGLVGTHLMSQMGFNSRGLMPDPIYPYRGPQQTSGVVEGRNDPSNRSQKAAIGTSVMNDGTHPFFGPQQTAAKLLAKGVYGKTLADQVNDLSSRQLRFNSSIEILPNKGNRVGLHPTLKDPAGLPVPEIKLAIDAYTQRGIDWAIERHQQMFKTLKATEVTHDSQAESDTAIIAGTARMGRDPSRSVVDLNLQSHDHQNLYILGASAHITAPINPPTLTIAALALKAADHLQKSIAAKTRGSA